MVSQGGPVFQALFQMFKIEHLRFAFLNRVRITCRFLVERRTAEDSATYTMSILHYLHSLSVDVMAQGSSSP